MNYQTNTIYFYHDFKKINFITWKRILQDLLDYHMIASDLEWVDNLHDVYIEIKTYMDKNGILPDEAKEQALNDNIDLIKTQIQELEALGNHTKMSQKKIRELTEELTKNQEELDFYNKYIKNNRFVFKKDKKGQQFFNKRKTALEIQEKMILNLYDDISFSKKHTMRKLERIGKRIAEEVQIKDFDIVSLYKYIKPYVNVIMTTPDYGYDFLQKNLFLDY